MSRILLTGARAPATLHLARLLHAAGHVVFAADSSRFPISRFSRAVEKTCRVPSPVFKPALFIQRLVSIIQQERIDCLIPTCEEIFHIAPHLNRLQAACRDCTIWTETIDRLRPLHDKWRFSRMVDDPEVSVPETRLLRAKADLAHCGIPPDAMVLKPVFSRFADNTLIRPSATERASWQCHDGQAWIAQRFISGTEFSSYSFVRQGRLLLHGCYFSPYRAGRGAGIYFEPVAHAGIRRFVERFSKKQAWTGHLAFDFIEDTSGRLFVLECNPRLTSGIHLFQAAEGSHRVFLDENPTGCIEPAMQPVPMLGMIMALYGPRQHAGQQFRTDFFQGRDVVFSARDPLPFFGQALSLAEMAAGSLKHQTSLLAATTRDIEWNGDEQPAY